MSFRSGPGPIGAEKITDLVGEGPSYPVHPNGLTELEGQAVTAFLRHSVPIGHVSLVAGQDTLAVRVDPNEINSWITEEPKLRWAIATGPEEPSLYGDIRVYTLADQVTRAVYSTEAEAKDIAGKLMDEGLLRVRLPEGTVSTERLAVGALRPFIYRAQTRRRGRRTVQRFFPLTRSVSIERAEQVERRRSRPKTSLPFITTYQDNV